MCPAFRISCFSGGFPGVDSRTATGFSGARDGRTVIENVLELEADSVWAREDVRRKKADRGVALRQCRGVAAPIPNVSLPIGVELSAVAFHDEPTVDEEVDPAHPCDDDLQFGSMTECAQDQSDERLDSCFAAGIQQCPERLERVWKATEHLVDAVDIHHADVPRAVKCGDGVSRRLAKDRLRQRLHYLDSQRCGGR
ncbi:MAG: hypothetical protein K0S37_3150 [Microbacterium sp.]|nr:hypothetical protein [Microbacterium sp.]